MALTRGARFILTFMLLAVLISVGSVAAGLFLAGRGPSIGDESVLWLRVPSNLAERQPDDLFGRETPICSGSIPISIPSWK